MRWNVEGADARTGRNQVISIEAENALDAERVATQRGMLVAAVHPSTIGRDDAGLPDVAPPPSTPASRTVAQPGTVIEPAPAEAPRGRGSAAVPRNRPRYVSDSSDATADSASTKRGTPSYNEIVVQSRMMDNLASFVRIIGLLCFAFAGVLLLSPIGESIGPGRSLTKDRVLEALGQSYVAAVYGLFLFIAAALLRAVGAVSLAIRDLARNSFRE